MFVDFPAAGSLAVMMAVLARLGRVIYWAACLIAGALTAVILYAMFILPEQHPVYQSNQYVGLLLAGGIWLVGLAIRYVLAGETPVWLGLFAPVIGGAVTLFGLHWLLARAGLAPLLAWSGAILAAIVSALLVLVWQVRDLLLVVPFPKRGTSPGEAFLKAFDAAYALKSGQAGDMGRATATETFAEEGQREKHNWPVAQTRHAPDR